VVLTYLLMLMMIMSGNVGLIMVSPNSIKWFIRGYCWVRYLVAVIIGAGLAAIFILGFI